MRLVPRRKARVIHFRIMLKRLAILGLLLAVAGSAPLPGQTTDHGNQSSHNPKDQAAKGKAPSKPTITLVEKNCQSDQLKDDPDCKKAENEIQLVTIREVPTTGIAIQSSAKRDKYDWLAYWGALALVGVGFIGVILARMTLLAIKRQADLMKEQADLAKSKERARLRVEMGDVSLSPTTDFLECGTTWVVNIYGTTEAFIVASECHCWIGDRDRFMSPGWLDPAVLPEVILPGSEPLRRFATLKSADSSREATPDELDAIRRGEGAVYCKGSIVFKNVFDETWMLSFARKYWVKQFPDSSPLEIWTLYGPQADNSESQLYPFVVDPPKPRWFEWFHARPHRPKPN